MVCCLQNSGFPINYALMKSLGMGLISTTGMYDPLLVKF